MVAFYGSDGSNGDGGTGGSGGRGTSTKSTSCIKSGVPSKQYAIVGNEGGGSECHRGRRNDGVVVGLRRCCQRSLGVQQPGHGWR